MVLTDNLRFGSINNEKYPFLFSWWYWSSFFPRLCNCTRSNWLSWSRISFWKWLGYWSFSSSFCISFYSTVNNWNFFGALDVFGWPWYGALFITLPGLLFMVPGAIGIAIVGLASIFKGNPKVNPQTNYNYQEEPKDVTPKETTPKTIKKITKTKKVIKKKTK